MVISLDEHSIALFKAGNCVNSISPVEIDMTRTFSITANFLF